jgi:RNA polymerase sigma-70 factor (ECF subfamily)
MAMRTSSERAEPKVDNERLSDLIVAIANAGDRGAFAALFKHFAPRLKAFAIRQGVGATTAEELMQEAMLSVWRKSHTFDPKRATASTWVYTILRNKRIDMLRREHRPNMDIDDVPERASESASADDDYEARQTGDLLRQAMDDLPADQVEVLQKAFFEDKSHSIVAEELTLPLGTVKSRIRLALSRMRSKLPEGQI